MQLNLSKEAAKKFGLPPELVAGTVAVEIVDDTDWYDKLLDDLFQKYPLNLHYSSFAREQSPLLYAATEWFLNGYEDYFGFLGGRGPGNGVANVHIATAKSVEDYFAKYYSDQHLLDTPASGYARSRVLLTDSGNIYYTAAYLRMIADYRTGIRGSHITDLDDFDMQMIYGRFRCDCWDSWAEFAKATDLPHLTTGLDSRGQVLAPFLKLYRTYYFVNQVFACCRIAGSLSFRGPPGPRNLLTNARGTPHCVRSDTDESVWLAGFRAITLFTMYLLREVAI